MFNLTAEKILEYEEKVTQKVEIESKNGATFDSNHPEKINPIVIALLVSEEGKEIWSKRGEMLEGDHAEFNLIMNKLNGTDHRNDKLFVSLEPCTHDSRGQTISCSELIVKAGIKDVYIGTFDPDQTVENDGALYLLNNGVRVQLFDEKFKKRLIDANKLFFNGKKSKIEPYRRFEREYKDFISDDAMLAYLFFSQNDKTELIDIGQLKTILKATREKQSGNLLKNFYDFVVNKRYVYNEIIDGKKRVVCEDGFKLAFYKNPSNFKRGSYIKIIDMRGNDETIAIVKKNESLIIAILESYLEIKKLIGDDLYNSIKHPLREILINTCCHKNYESCSPVNIYIYDDRIEFNNPVDLNKISIENMNNFTMPSNPINGDLIDIIMEMNFIECQGKGFNTLKTYMKNNKALSDKHPYELISDILITKLYFGE